MIGFDVGDVPNIGRVFAKRITRKFTFIWAFKVFFPRVFRRDSYGVKVEGIRVCFGEPQNSFVPT